MPLPADRCMQQAENFVASRRRPARRRRDATAIADRGAATESP
jgi:hypothetical protein